MLRRGDALVPTVSAKAAQPAKIDGRHERTKRTRAAIVGALTELLDEGRIEPTAVEIAERASVAVRSIGQHFASREELLLACLRAIDTEGAQLAVPARHLVDLGVRPSAEKAAGARPA